MSEFSPFGKIPRLNRPVVVTEKLDGTNAQVFIEYVMTAEPLSPYVLAIQPEVDANGVPSGHEFRLYAGSRTRWLLPQKQQDNHGFATWVIQHKDELFGLGTGRHFGEWWGVGINRGYDLSERRFSLFNVGRWSKTPPPACCLLVPQFVHLTDPRYGIQDVADIAIEELREKGSIAAPGYMKPEGVVVYHTASGNLYKVTVEHDEAPKTVAQKMAVS
jgi:RNA ligase